MPPAETGVTVLAKAVLAIADDPFPLELRGPGLSMIEALAAETGGTTTMAVANRWMFAHLRKRQLADLPSTAAAFHTTIAQTMLERKSEARRLGTTRARTVESRGSQVLY